MSNKTLTEELHKPIIRKFNKRTVHSFFIDNLWGADLGDMQFLSKFKKFVFYYVSLIFSVNAHGLFLIKMVLQLLMLFKIF